MKRRPRPRPYRTVKPRSAKITRCVHHAALLCQKPALMRCDVRSASCPSTNKKSTPAQKRDVVTIYKHVMRTPRSSPPGRHFVGLRLDLPLVDEVAAFASAETGVEVDSCFVAGLTEVLAALIATSPLHRLLPYSQWWSQRTVLSKFALVMVVNTTVEVFFWSGASVCHIDGAVVHLTSATARKPTSRSTQDPRCRRRGTQSALGVMNRKQKELTLQSGVSALAIQCRNHRRKAVMCLCAQ